MRIAEGDLYSGTRVRASKARVTALGFFDSVEINQKRGSSDDKMVLEVSVKEKLTGTFQIGSDSRAGRTSSARRSSPEQLVRIRPHRLALAAALERPPALPAQLPRPLRAGLAVDGFDRSLPQRAGLHRVQPRANGGSLTAGYDFSNLAPWLEDFRIFLTYTLENVHVQAAVGTQDVLANQFLSGLTSSIRISFNYDKRDNRLFPTSGHLESASAEFATSLLGSENLFQRYRFIERFYRPLWLAWSSRRTSRSGTSGPPTPSITRWPSARSSSRRHQLDPRLLLRSISPTLKIATVSEPNSGIIDFPVGGNKELITNWEVEFPLLGSAGLRGVGFFDAGNVFSEQENFFHSSQRNGTLPWACSRAWASEFAGSRPLGRSGSRSASPSPPAHRRLVSLRVHHRELLLGAGTRRGHHGSVVLLVSIAETPPGCMALRRHAESEPAGECVT